MAQLPSSPEYGSGSEAADPVLHAVRRLAGGMVHEYNNVLGGILGYSAHLVGRADGNPGLQEDLRQILTAAEAGTALTRRLQAFAQRHQFRPAAVPVAALLEEVRSSVAATAPRRRKVELDAEPAVPDLSGQRASLAVALAELARNGLEALPGAGRVILRARFDPGREAVRLEVVDDGEGIPAELLDTVILPFVTTRREAGHLGLGLSMAYGIVANHGGRLRIRSAPGAGTTVAVRLPAACPGAGPEAGPEPESDTRRASGTERILVVDDEPLVRTMVSEVLRGYGYQVELAESGPQALERLRGADPPVELVVMDLSMPGMGGEETCREITGRL